MKINFSNPERNKIVIFDSEGSKLLRKAIFYDLNVTVLEANKERLYLGPRIMILLLKNLKYLRFKEIIACRNVFAQLYAIYLLSCLEYIKPLTVVTFIDNSSFFHWVSQKYKNAKFYAIQNGTRNISSVTDFLSPKPHFASMISIPYFFCFGDYEKDLYEKYGQNIGAFMPCGSLRASYYKSAALEDPNAMDQFDICLISEWGYSLFNENSYPYIRRSLEVLNQYLKSYILENKYRVCIALRTDSSMEKKYYRDIFGDRVTLFANNQETLSTYLCIERSNIIISCFSTCGIEALAWNKKVLFCNFSCNSNFDMTHIPWFVKTEKYESFKAKLDELKNTKIESYVESIKDSARYLMDYSHGPTHEYIRRIIYSGVKS